MCSQHPWLTDGSAHVRLAVTLMHTQPLAPKMISHISTTFNTKQLHTNGKNWKASDFFIQRTLHIIANAVIAIALINPIKLPGKSFHSLLPNLAATSHSSESDLQLYFLPIDSTRTAKAVIYWTVTGDLEVKQPWL